MKDRQMSLLQISNLVRFRVELTPEGKHLIFFFFNENNIDVYDFQLDFESIDSFMKELESWREANKISDYNYAFIRKQFQFTIVASNF